MTKDNYQIIYKNPYAGEYKKEYLDVLYTRVRMFNDTHALSLLRENVWLIEGLKEIHIRKWESVQYRNELIARFNKLRIPYKEMKASWNPKNFLQGEHKVGTDMPYIHVI